MVKLMSIYIFKKMITNGVDLDESDNFDMSVHLVIHGKEFIADGGMTTILDSRSSIMPIPTKTISKASTSRFAESKSEELHQAKTNNLKSKATEIKQNWAVNLFSDWRVEKNINEVNLGNLSDILCQFILEVRKQNGDEYPPQSLYQIVMCLQNHLNNVFQKNIQILKDENFLEVRNTLDFEMKKLTENGIGTVNSAQEITESMEDMLWEKHILGCETPKQLQETLLYLLGYNFALRGKSEHRQLKWRNLSLIEVEDSTTILRYTEDFSKNNQGGLLHKKIMHKSVDAVENKIKPERCIVCLFEKYRSLCPSVGNDDPFYLTPLQKPKENIWYYKVPVSQNTLNTTVKCMCQKAGFQGKFTNHSLRVTAASRLYKNNIDEQQICEITGHGLKGSKSVQKNFI